VAASDEWWEHDLWLVSFRVMSDTIPTADVSARLDLQPDSAHDAGDEIPDEDETFVFPRSVWTFDSGLPFTEDLRTHLLALLEVLEPRAEAIAGLLAAGCEIDFFAGLTSGDERSGTNLDADLLGRVAQLGANIDLSLSNDESVSPD
jgi:hypothetical protein